MTEPIPAIHQTAEESEQQLIDRAQQAVSQSAWVIGECASKWTERYARGRGDAEFAEMIGLSREQVAQRRNVWDKMCNTYYTFHTLSWSHFNVALNWPDAETYLQWAFEFDASVKEMRAYRNSQTGESEAGTSTKAENEPEPVDTDIEETPPFEVEPAESQKDPEPAKVVQPKKAEVKPSKAEKLEPVKSEPDPHADAITRVLNVADAVAAVRQLASVAIESYDDNQRRELAAALIEQARRLVPEVVEDEPQQVVDPMVPAKVIISEWNMLGEDFTRCGFATEKIRKLVNERMTDPAFQNNWRIALERLPQVPHLAPNLTDFLRPGAVDDIIEATKERKPAKPKAKAKRFEKPTVEQVEAYCKERNNAVDAAAFWDFYESKGWKVGKEPMKDWQAAIRNWERRDEKTAGQPPSGKSAFDDVFSGDWASAWD